MVGYGDRTAQPSPFSHAETGLSERARRASVQRVFAFDRPGELAFYEGLSVLAGLTTNVVFQKQLAERGLDWALEEFRIPGRHRAAPGRFLWRRPVRTVLSGIPPIHLRR